MRGRGRKSRVSAVFSPVSVEYVVAPSSACRLSCSSGTSRLAISIVSAIRPAMRLTERMASSLPGMG